MNGRIYDPNLHRFLQLDNNIQDPFNTQNYNRYGYVLNNPLKYTDPSGEFWNLVAGYLLSGYIMGAYASGGELNPAKWNSSAFISIGAAGASAGASAVATNLTNNYLDNYNKPPVLGFSAVGSGNDIHSFVNDTKDKSFNGNFYSTKREDGVICPNCLDPNTIGHNLFYLSYPGGDNPRSYNGDYNYSYVPKNMSEFPAIGHDRRYDNLGTNGLVGLLSDVRAIGADWKFVQEEMKIAITPINGMAERIKAGTLGVGLGLAAMPKTLLFIAQPIGFMKIRMWYEISDYQVNNSPSIHKH